MKAETTATVSSRSIDINVRAQPEKNDDARYELKFSCELDQLANVYSWIHTSAALFRTEYPDRVINNVYYDTYAMECMRTNLIGVGYRYKARLRWYGGHCPEKLVLEYKVRRGRVGSKTRHEIEGGNLEQLSLAEVRRRLLKEVDPEYARMAGDFAVPVLRNTYRRSYFVSLDGRFRLTIDSDQEFFDLRRSSCVVGPQERYPYPYFVIEFKADQSDVSSLSDIVRTFPLSVRRNSKYLVGVSSLLRVPYI